MPDITGMVFNIQKFSVDDGPGIRTTVFLKGCPLHCIWCHNPESHQKNPEIFYYDNKCIGCGACAVVCPKKCHRIEKKEDQFSHVIDRTACIGCGKCAKICPAKALALAGKTMTPAEVVKEVLSDKIFYDQSGGGMTISGGEPLAQPLFTEELCKTAAENSIRIAIETSGFGKRECLERILPYVELFLFDYKAEPEDYPKLTGVAFDSIKDNLRFISDHKGQIILRCPIIPDINDNEKHYEGIASLASSISGIQEIHLEAYHPLGISKAEQLGKNQEYDNREFLDRKTLNAVCSLIEEKSGKCCKIS